jgi:hypothetical protein
MKLPPVIIVLPTVQHVLIPQLVPLASVVSYFKDKFAEQVVLLDTMPIAIVFVKHALLVAQHVVQMLFVDPVKMVIHLIILLVLPDVLLDNI